MKNKIKVISRYIVIYVSMIILFLVSMYGVTVLPKSNMEEHITKASKVFENSTEQVLIKNLFNYTYLDDFTDAVMINVAYSLDNTDPIKSILLIRQSYDKDRTLTEKDLNPFVNLKAMIQKTNTEYTTYGRYWHGYIIYLKPLLMIFNYQTIRYIFVAILNILAIIFIYLMYKKVDKSSAIIIAISLVIIGYQFAGLSLTYFPVLAISMITSILIVIKKDIKLEVMFIIGGLTSFFDLLTTPILTLGIPLVTYLIVCKEKATYKKMFLMCLNWILGFGIIWASKWIIADCTIHENIIENALTQVKQRTGNYENGENLTFFKTVVNNINWISYEFIALICLTLICLIIYKKGNKEILKKELMKYLLIAIMPFIWYFVIRNHSYVHSKFTYKDLLLTLISLGIIDYKILKNSISNKKRKIDIDE